MDNTIREGEPFKRPSRTDIESTWMTIFRDPLLSLSRMKAQASTREGLGEADEDGGVNMRSVYWRLYYGLLPPPTSPNLFAPSLEASRAAYTSLRRRYLIAPDGRWAADCSPDDSDPRRPSSSTQTRSDGSGEGWDPLSLDGQSPWKTWFAHQDLRTTIMQDVDRTFPDIQYFRLERVRRIMVTVLFLFSVQNPDVGYRQGMHELLAVCLLAVDRDSLDAGTAGVSASGPSSSSRPILEEAMRATLDRRFVEHDAFGLFNEIMKGAKPFYEWRAEEGPRSRTPVAPQAPILIRCQNLHTSLLRRIDPQLWERFELEGLEPQIWAIRWIRLILTRELPFSVALRIWDGLLAETPGLDLLDFICLSMLLLIRNELLDADYSTLLSQLLRYPAPSLDYPFSPHLILSQAIFLRNNVTPAGGVEVVLQNQDVLGIRAAPPDKRHLRSPRSPRGRPSGHADQQHRDSSAAAHRAGVGLLAQGLFERAQAAGLDKTFLSTVADLRKNLPDANTAYSYLPNLPFSPLGAPPTRDNSQFSSIPSSTAALPKQRSSFFSAPHHGPSPPPTAAIPPPAPPKPASRQSTDSNISIKSLRDAERDIAELRLAMVGMGKAMNEWMATLPPLESGQKSEAWDGLGRVRDTLLDAAGCEVGDIVRQWGWHEGLEAPRSSASTPAPVSTHRAPQSGAALPGRLAENDRALPSSVPVDVTPTISSTWDIPDTPKVSSFPSSVRSAPLQHARPQSPAGTGKPNLHLSSRDDRPMAGLSRVPQTAPIKSSQVQSPRSPAFSAVDFRRPSPTVSSTPPSSTSEPLTGRQLPTSGRIVKLDRGGGGFDPLGAS